MNTKEVLEKLAGSLTRASEFCKSNAERKESIGLTNEAIRLFGRASAYADASRYLLGSYLGDAVDEIVQKPESEARYIVAGYRDPLTRSTALSLAVDELHGFGCPNGELPGGVTVYRIEEELVVRVSLEPVPMKPLREPTYGTGNIPRPAGPMGAPAEEKGEQE